MLGITGRVGRAIVAGVDAAGLVGFARHTNAASADLGRFVAGDRRDVAALVAAIDGTDAVVDLAGHDVDDAEALIAALARCAVPPRRVVLASSLAERLPSRWAQHPASVAELDDEAAPEDDYGAGKRALRRRLAAALGPLAIDVHALLLPQLHALDDLNGRERAYIAAARAGRSIELPGGGTTRPAVVATDTAAAALLALATWRPALNTTAPTLGHNTVWQLAPADRPTLGALVAALLRGAGATAVIASGNGRPLGHSGADETVDGAPLRAWLPALPWPDLIDRHAVHGAALGAALDAALDATRRPA